MNGSPTATIVTRNAEGPGPFTHASGAAWACQATSLDFRRTRVDAVLDFGCVADFNMNGATVTMTARSVRA